MKLLTYLITLGFFFISCDTLPFYDSGDNKDGLTETLTLSQSQFNSIEDVSATFTLKNNTSHKLRFNFPSGCQYGFTVTKDDSTYIDSRNYFGCTLATSELIIPGNETKSFPISLNFLNEYEDFVADFEPGTYQLNAFLLEGHSDAASAEFEAGN